MKFLVSLLLSLSLGFSTTLYGEIYDGETFELAENAVVRVTGAQTNQILASGNYSLDLAEGEYTVYAYIIEGKRVKATNEKI
ncbi:hypothetical protein HZC08_01025, partial [Candidatus Micrarchaeota archaeon]|nr:hypothetical protein [Candidatus Micrarchaeota archaeon]